VQEVWSLRDRTWYAVRLPGVRGQEGEVSAVVHPGEQALLAVARADAPVMLVDLCGADVGTLDDSAGSRAVTVVHGNGRLVLLERGNQQLCCEVPTTACVIGSDRCPRVRERWRPWRSTALSAPC
jgi:hypothetical protein